jgi:hypothetical protein
VIRNSRALLAVACLLLAGTLPRPVQADDEDLLSSIYTENGIELRRDDRLFVFYAALNAAGYNRAEATRTLPFPKYALHPLRQKVRQQLANPPDKLEKVRPAVERFLDAHPVALEQYVSAVLTLGPAPAFVSGTDTPKNFAGIDKMLAEFAEGAHLAKISHGMAVDFREILKKLRDPVDGPFSSLRKTYHLNEEKAPNLVLVPNPLDAPEVAIARHATDGNHVVVFGVPADDKDLDLQPALKAYSALLAEESAKGVTVDGLSTAVEHLHADGVLGKDVTEASIVSESLRAAVDAKLWSKDPGGAADEAFRHGLIFAPEFLKALGEAPEAFPADQGSFAAQVAGRMNVEKALTQLSRPSSIRK